MLLGEQTTERGTVRMLTADPRTTLSKRSQLALESHVSRYLSHQEISSPVIHLTWRGPVEPTEPRARSHRPGLGSSIS